MNTDRFLSKAKRLDNGEWVDGYYFHIEPYHKIHAFQYDKSLHNIDPSTLCQCVGVDLNESNVFDGDILEIEYEEEHEFIVKTYKATFEVWFNESDLTVYLREFVDFVYHEEDDYVEYVKDYIEDYPISDMCNDGIIEGEVIGNIHDKKEEVER